MKITLIITYLLNLFDLFCTMLWVNRFGIEVEANPIGRYLIQNGGVYFVKIVVVAVALYVLYRCTRYAPKLKWICWILLAVYSILAVYHLILILLT